MQKEGPGVGRPQRCAGPRAGNLRFVLGVRGQQAFSVKGPMVSNLDLAGHSTTQLCSCGRGCVAIKLYLQEQRTVLTPGHNWPTLL